MTLQPYGPDRLDGLALRAFDIASILRSMAEECRAREIDSVDLHDKKSLEWIARLDQWAHDAEAKFQMQLIKDRGSKKATDATK